MARNAHEVPMQFVDALNRRDPQRLAALAEPTIEFRPLHRNGKQERYSGHDGLHSWAADALRTDEPPTHTRVRKVRTLEDERVVLLADLVIEDEELARTAMLFELGAEGRLARFDWYFTEEEVLEHLGML